VYARNKFNATKLKESMGVRVRSRWVGVCGAVEWDMVRKGMEGGKRNERKRFKHATDISYKHNPPQNNFK